jgi:hypothetical protein
MEAGTPELPESGKKKRGFFSRLLRFFFFLSGTFILLIIAAISLVFIYEDEVKEAIISELNKNLAAEVKVKPENIELTILKTFPHCALQFNDIACMEVSKSKTRDTLFFTQTLQLKFNVSDLWNKQYHIKKISIDKGFARLKINNKGKPNYIIWKESPAKAAEKSEALSFSLDLIELKQLQLSYRNAKDQMAIQAHLNFISFSGAFQETAYQLSSKGQMHLQELTSGGINYISDKTIDYRAALDVEGNQYRFKDCKISLHQLNLKTAGEFTYDNTLQHLKLNFEGEKLNIRSVLSLLPSHYRNRINDYESKGSFYVNGGIEYHDQLKLDMQFGVEESDITYVPLQTTLTRLNTKGRLIILPDSTLFNLSGFSASLLNDEIKAEVKLSNFKKPYLSLQSSGRLNLANLMRFWPIDTLAFLKGSLEFNTVLQGKLSDLQKNVLQTDTRFDLDADIKRLVFQIKGQADSTAVETCNLAAHDRNVLVKNLGIVRGKSDLTINGSLTGVFNYLMDKTNALSISGSVKSKTLYMEDFIFGSSAASNTKSEVHLPDNLHFYVDAVFDRFYFGKFNASNVSGNLELKNNKLFAEGISLNTMNGNAQIDALMDMSKKNVEVSVQGKLNQLDVSELFLQLNNFNQQTLTEKNLGGVLTASVDFTGSWNRYLEPDLNAMTASADLRIVQGKLMDFKPLESLSKFVDIQDLKNIRFSDLNSRIDISKGVISIPKTVIKNSALNIDVWGKHTFNNEIDYHIQMLISELLAKKRKSKEDEFGAVENDPDNRRSAFVLMTGTVDNPIIKYDRTGLKQKIKEDIKQEKQNLKQILKEEFGLFKKDSIKGKEVKKVDTEFKLEKESTPKKSKQNKEEEDDDF